MKKIDIMGGLKRSAMVGVGAVGGTKLANEICKDYAPKTATTEAKGVSPVIAGIGLVVLGTFGPSLLGKSAAKFSDVFSGLTSAGTIALAQSQDIVSGFPAVSGIGAADFFPMPDRNYTAEGNSIAGPGYEEALI
ncbi:MAG: hypothetical protein ACXWXW_00950 [Bacteroidia bacterium]